MSGFWIFLIVLAICAAMVICFYGSDSTLPDCTDCVHGASTGKGICKECDGSYFERREEL